MSESLYTFERPASNKSAGHYLSYLWLGHCVSHPKDYNRDIVGYHQSRKDQEHNYTLFRSKQLQGPGAVLITQLQRIIKGARSELGLEPPFNPSERLLLKVHLVGEVSVRGMELAHENGLIDDYPDLANVTSPFVDGRLIDGALRAAQRGRIDESFARYATIERLLPGYAPVISV